MNDDAAANGQRIVILGGGTAGWMAACLFAKAWPAARITLVEAPDIPIVGVGEGSTPQMAALMAGLGIAEADWMPAAHATYKLGIAFHGWSGKPDHACYFHPFPGAIDAHTQGQFHFNTLARRRGEQVAAHPDRFFLNARLAAARRAPLTPPSFPFAVGYGYHFDAHLVGAVLRAGAIRRGVTHLRRRVGEVAVGTDRTVTHLVLDDGQALAGDLFVDASGFRSVIAQDALGERFLPFGSNLFCDAAVTIASPRQEPLDAHTGATALSAGWAWRIPLTHRTGNGYVYSTRYLSRDAAEAELRAHLGGTDAPARHLAMKVGRVERSWTGNCLAIGLAQGFIEPLEATALHLVQATVEGFVADWQGGGFTPARRDAFNARIARRYEGVRDYIVCHYRANTRGTSDFWRDNAANDRLSDDLRAILHAWFTGGDVAATLDARDLGGFYPAMSWEVLLAGYGTFPDAVRLRPAPDRVDLPALEAFLDGCLLNFGDHAAMLDRLAA